ncbi:hypothetical protein U5817_08325 [Aromatoleum evansii]|uniref:Uncharacterized protein n=1 Tax=Aromatoleum evansii TaxID=59406 RepID=A0ABZ1AQ87_AROEV|nr:hypothetical protein U5817_08325 [Aromatoleum evansii]
MKKNNSHLSGGVFVMNDLPPPISPLQQEVRTQAIVTIGHFLEGLGEPGWRSVLLGWLGRYDGLEVYLYLEDDPVLTVRDLLARYVEALRPADPVRLAADLAALPFCRYRAQRGDEKWRPLAETFSSFCRGTTVEVWESERPAPPPQVLENWLLAQFCAAQICNRRG